MRCDTSPHMSLRSHLRVGRLNLLRCREYRWRASALTRFGSRSQEALGPLIAALAEHPVETLTSREPSLEEIFLHHYDGSGGDGGN